jgi:bacteriocin biosynthesis cyclodehydratase domain-containing protein
MNDPLRRRPRLSLPYTVLTAPDTVRLVAGEDFRYTLTAQGLDQWLPGLLGQLDGRRSLNDLINGLNESQREPARQLLERLYGERVLVDGTAIANHPASRFSALVEGTGQLAERLRSSLAVSGETDPSRVGIFCQDTLDYAAALEFNRRCRASGSPWLWVSSGAMQRGYVGPLFLPDAGPCLACLVRQFQRLSPAPELYDHLLEHARNDRPIAPALFPPQGIEILKQLVLWKLSLVQEVNPSPALYRLHVLEIASLEVTSHRVFVDPECPACKVTS